MRQVEPKDQLERQSFEAKERKRALDFDLRFETIRLWTLVCDLAK